MAENKRTEQERERDLEQTAEMYVRGFRQVDIAKKIGVSQSQIAYDLKDIRKRWRESTIRDFDAAKEEELAKLDATEQEAWDAYRRSQEERQKTFAESVASDGGRGEKRTRTQVTKEKGYGDPRFLQTILTCIDRRCKILGIDAPTKLEHSGVVETKSEVDLKGLSIDELRTLDTILSRAGTSPEGSS